MVIYTVKSILNEQLCPNWAERVKQNENLMLRLLVIRFLAILQFERGHTLPHICKGAERVDGGLARNSRMTDRAGYLMTLSA